MTLSKALLAEIDHENASTRKLIDLVPDAKFSWRPHRKSMTIGELATHLANGPAWVGRVLDATEFDLATILGATWKPPEVWGRPQVVESFDAGWGAARAKIAAATDADLMHPWTLRRGPDVVATLPRIAALRSFVISHMIHHRGQMTVYLRLLDVPLPGIYGPTADAAL